MKDVYVSEQIFHAGIVVKDDGSGKVISDLKLFISRCKIVPCELEFRQLLPRRYS